MPPEPPRTVRIFVSSPSDVRPERAATLRALELLNRRYMGLLKLEGVYWEEHFFPSTVDFQTWIDERIPPWECDLVICILWSRIGTPLAESWPARDDGSHYESGTVAEFEMARQKALAGPTPDLYMFLKTAAPPAGASSDDMIRAAEAKRTVENFVHRWFHQADAVAMPGAENPVRPFTAGLNPFASIDGFEELFVRFLEYWLRHKNLIDRPVTWDVHTQGLPYVGLAPFTPTHAGVFFGRDADRRVARRLLIEAEARGMPYLLLTGGSGVGKSSLARAGLVPDLCVDTPQEVWANAVMLAGPDPLQHLAEALLEGDCALAPHLADSFFPDAVRLAPALADPATAAAIVAGALDAHAEHLREINGWERAPQSRLLLVVDQAEALADADKPGQAGLVGVLAALLSLRRVWVIATMRLDRVGALLTLPPLAPLLTRDLRGKGQEGAELKLAAPDEAAMRDIIEAPAHAAGLSFEERDGRSLAEELRGEVAGQPDALPLLQRLLETLFGDGRVASWARYEAIGRLAGAIAAAADAALAGTSAEAQAELRPLLLALTGQWGEDGVATGRPVDRSAFETTPARTALVQALLDARLLATDARGQIRVAHEALLRTWPQARAMLTQAADFLRLRDRLRQPAAEWSMYGTVLPPGPLLASAQAALPAFQAEAETAPLAGLIEASLRADRRARRRRTTVFSVVTAVLLLLTAGAGIGFWQARQAQGRAEAATRRAAAEFDAAESAVSTMLFDLAQNLKHRMGVPANLVSEILGLADRALANLDRAAPDDPRVRRLRFASLDETVQVLLVRGDIPAAKRAVTAERSVAESLAASDPDSPGRQRDLSVAYEKMGDVLTAQGDGPGALTAFRSSLAIRERFGAADPASALWQRDISTSRNKIGGVLLSQGDRVGALAAYRASKAIRERLAAAAPNDPQRQRDLSISLDNVGGLLLAQGDRDGALEAHRAAFAIGERLAIADPTNAELQRDVSVSHNNIGAVLFAMDDLPGALTEYRAGKQIIERLTATDAGNTDWQRDLSVSDDKIGRVLAAQGDPDGALASYRSGMAIATRLSAADPANLAWQRDLMVSKNTIGNVLLQQGDKDGALAAYQSGKEIAERLAAADHANADWQRDLEISHNKVGQVLGVQGRKADALASFRAGMVIAERLAASDADSAEWQRDLLISLYRVSSGLLANDEPAQACPFAQRMSDLAGVIDVKFPQDPARAAYHKAADDLVEAACKPPK